MPKGQHLTKKITLKNWKTGRIITRNSHREFCLEFNIPIQACSDVICGRRKYYRHFALPNFNKDSIMKCQFKNLKTSRIYKLQSFKNAQKIFGLSLYHLKRLSIELNYRYKHYAHIDWSNYKSIPVIINKLNGTITKIYDRKEWAKKHGMSYSKSYYFLESKRIKANKQFKLKGQKDYKYLILDKNTGSLNKTLQLKQFAIKNNLKPDALYIRNPKFEVVEG